MTFVARCQSNKTKTYGVWGTYLGWRNDQKPVKVRIGDQPAESDLWGVSTDNSATFSPMRGGDLLEEVLTAERMVMQSAWAAGHAECAQRTAYFCAGCPHSTSTKVPEGGRALPGIGCHAMTEINERTTDGQIAMGGEGATWVGQAPFARDRHVFANLGDGTYYHSGLLAI